jgi:hypothetical protein
VGIQHRDTWVLERTGASAFGERGKGSKGAKLAATWNERKVEYSEMKAFFECWSANRAADTSMPTSIVGLQASR